MVYSVLSVESLDTASPGIDTLDKTSRERVDATSTKPASSDSLIQLLGGSAATGTLEILEKFFAHLEVSSASRICTNDEDSRLTRDWGLAMGAISESISIEQAIGRAVVIADKLHQGSFAELGDRDGPIEQVRRARCVDDTANATAWAVHDGDPFFSFSVADSLPDFGDQSRYRTRLANKVGRILKPRRVPDAAVAS